MRGREPQRRAWPGMAGLALVGMMFTPLPTEAATVTQPDDKSSATIVIPLTIINLQATCDLTFSGAGLGSSGGIYTLGSLTMGEEKTHPSFKAAIACQGADVGSSAVRTALVASARGAVATNGGIRMQVDGQQNPKGPELWLETGKQTVPLDGSTAFCKGTSLALNECTLTPHTRVAQDAPAGQVSATVVFDIVYT